MVNIQTFIYPKIVQNRQLSNSINCQKLKLTDLTNEKMSIKEISFKKENPMTLERLVLISMETPTNISPFLSCLKWCEDVLETLRVINNYLYFLCLVTCSRTDLFVLKSHNYRLDEHCTLRSWLYIHVLNISWISRCIYIFLLVANNCVTIFLGWILFSFWEDNYNFLKTEVYYANAKNNIYI